MKASKYKTFKIIAAWISVIAIVRLIIAVVTWLWLPQRYWVTGLERQYYVQGVWLTLIVAALSIFVTVLIGYLEETDEKTEFLSRKTIEQDKKLKALQEALNTIKRKSAAKQQDINSLHQKLDKLTETDFAREEEHA